MSKRQFVVLAFRLFALYLAFELLLNLSKIFSTPSTLGPRFFISFLGPSAAATLALGLIFILWRKTAWLKTSGTPVSTSSSGRWLNPFENPYILVVSIIGIWEVFHNLSGVFADVSFIYLPTIARGPFDMLFTGLWISEMVPAAVSVLLGAWIFMLPWHLQKMMEKYELRSHSGNGEVEKLIS